MYDDHPLAVNNDQSVDDDDNLMKIKLVLRVSSAIPEAKAWQLM